MNVSIINSVGWKAFIQHERKHATRYSWIFRINLKRRGQKRTHTHFVRYLLIPFRLFPHEDRSFSGIHRNEEVGRKIS